MHSALKLKRRDPARPSRNQKERTRWGEGEGGKKRRCWWRWRVESMKTNPQPPKSTAALPICSSPVMAKISGFLGGRLIACGCGEVAIALLPADAGGLSVRAAGEVPGLWGVCGANDQPSQSRGRSAGWEAGAAGGLRGAPVGSAKKTGRGRRRFWNSSCRPTVAGNSTGCWGGPIRLSRRSAGR